MAQRIKKPSISEYKKMKRTAYEYVVMQGYTQKEAATVLGVSEQTMTDWAKEGNWKLEKRGRQSSVKESQKNIREIIRILSRQRLDIEREIEFAQLEQDGEKELELRKKAVALSDEISKQNKTLLNIDKENRITLGVYIDVMDDIFSAMRSMDEKLYMKTIDFQTQLIRLKTQELG